MAGHAELEIGLHRWTFDSYSLELRFTHPGPEGEVEGKLVRGLRFDYAALRDLAIDPARYGLALTAALFGDDAVKTAFAVACTEAAEQDTELRLRLFVGPSASELHALAWETLADPRADDGAWLVTSERVLFSRYVSSLGLLSGRGRARVRLRPQAYLDALVAIANPSGVSDYAPTGRPLAPVDVEGERTRAKSGLGRFAVTELVSPGVTLNALVDHLRSGHDILYLVCHGAFRQGEARLWLENEAGGVAVVAGSDLIARLRDLPRLPRLVVLASCQSAGGGEGVPDEVDAFERALGPSLAEVGIPAVLGMQGTVSMKTVARFMPKFFEELQRDGQVDRAMAVARGEVRGRPDSWMPTLFMRLRTGRLWYAPGFADRRGFQRWPVLLDSIKHRQCTPIIGPGMHESLLGSRREIAWRWAEDFGFPMAPDDRDDLPQVAQYVAVDQAAVFPPSALEQYLCRALLERYRDVLPPPLRDAPEPPLLDLIAAVGKHRRESDPVDPHKVLAELPFPIYVTTSPGNLLTEALRAAGKDPQIELCRWNEATKENPSIYDEEPGYRASVERPLVYHVFGHFANHDSLVLTEDNFFDYLIGVTRNIDLIPPEVNAALTNRALVFLGFQMEDWTFRVLFRTIMQQDGGRLRRKYAHVAVQVDPEDDRVIHPERARRYLQDYLQGEDVSVYWGNAEDFTRALWQEWQALGASPAPGRRP